MMLYDKCILCMPFKMSFKLSEYECDANIQTEVQMFDARSRHHYASKRMKITL